MHISRPAEEKGPATIAASHHGTTTVRDQGKSPDLIYHPSMFRTTGVFTKPDAMHYAIVVPDGGGECDVFFSLQPPFCTCQTRNLEQWQADGVKMAIQFRQLDTKYSIIRDCTHVPLLSGGRGPLGLRRKNTKRPNRLLPWLKSARALAAVAVLRRNCDVRVHGRKYAL